METNKTNGRTLLGAIIVVIGGLLLARNFGIIPYEIGRLIFNWKMILITIGIYQIYSGKNRNSGISLIAIGGIFLAPQIFNISINIWGILWPALLIYIGVSIITKNKKDLAEEIVEEISTPSFDILCFMGVVDKRILSKEFLHGKVTSIIGGAKLDLSKSEIAGEVATIDLFCFMGGCEIIIPENWVVKLDATCILGGFDQKKMIRLESDKPLKTLIIRGSVIMGGGEIKTY